MNLALKEHIEELLAAVPTERAARDLGDQLFGSGMAVWLAVMDEQGIPRERAIGLILRRCHQLGEQFAKMPGRPLDA